LVIDQPVPVSSCEVAEFSKLYENIYRSVNIALANEMKVIADKFGLDIFEIINAAATKPFGFSAFYPGPGVGGHCIPVDPAYLNWKAKSENVYSRLIDTAMEVNRNITDFVVNKTSKMLNKRGKSISAANILILGVSYKSNIDDIRESPALDIIEKLLDLKATISYDDKFVLKTSMKGKLRKIKKVINVTNSEKTIAKYDAILLLTNHDYYDYENIKKYADLVIDTRGVFINNKSNIERG
jgi:UDP-N-acetyl-D-glucosamine dehydrogenase